MRKVLLVSNNALSLKKNNGKTLNSLFAHWETGNIAHVYFNDEVAESLVVKHGYKFLGRDNLVSLLTFGLLGGGRVVNISDGDSPQSTLSTGRFDWLRRLINSNFEALKLLFRDGVYCKSYTNKRLNSWVDRFQPDCIFLVCGNNCFPIDLVRRISKEKNIPVHIYITDDYVLSGKSVGWLSGYQNARLVSRYVLLLKEAKDVFVISDYMALAYLDVFRRECKTLINCSLVSPYLECADSAITKDVLVMTYAGGLHLGRAAALVELANMVNIIADEKGLRVRLDVYSSGGLTERIKNSLVMSGVNYCGSLSWDELQLRLAVSDFLLHIESFAPEYINKTRYSLSTKIPEYLSTGKCVIAFGPEEVASIKFIRDNCLGAVIHDVYAEGRAVLSDVLSHEEIRQDFGRRAESYARKWFSREVAQNKLSDGLEG